MFKLPRRHAKEIVDHAREEAPNECCGILAGKDGAVLELYRAVNAEHSPYRFNVDKRDLDRIHAEVEAAGRQFLAIYHSHPAGQARPSPSDIAMALWPGVIHLIVSLVDPSSPQLRAFRIEEGRVVEEPLRVIG